MKWSICWVFSFLCESVCVCVTACLYLHTYVCVHLNLCVCLCASFITPVWKLKGSICLFFLPCVQALSRRCYFFNHSTFCNQTWHVASSWSSVRILEDCVKSNNFLLFIIMQCMERKKKSFDTSAIKKKKKKKLHLNTYHYFCLYLCLTLITNPPSSSHTYTCTHV